MKFWKITVEVPYEAGAEFADKMMNEVADAAYELQPEDRGQWDIFVYSVLEDESLYDEN